MVNKLLLPTKDPMGLAISDFYAKGHAARLRVFSPEFEEDEIPVKTLFRTFEEMPELEQVALQMAEGKILDVGAGSGCHSLVLKEMNKDVLSIDISPLSVEVMQARGLNAQQVNLFDPLFVGKFDTILMLMNGSGVIGKLKNMGAFFMRMEQLLNPGGCILMDSSDLRYLFFEENGITVDLTSDYFGEVQFCMRYKHVRGDRFPWLYIDFGMLSRCASFYGFKAEKIKTGSHFDYLARLTRK